MLKTKVSATGRGTLSIIYQKFQKNVWILKPANDKKNPMAKKVIAILRYQTPVWVLNMVNVIFGLTKAM